MFYHRPYHFYQLVLNKLRHLAHEEKLIIGSANIFRLFATIGLIFRFEYTASVYVIQPLVSYTIFASLSVVIWWFWYGISKRRSWIILQIILDTAIISILYWSTNNADSDIYLLLSIPILLAVERLRVIQISVYYLILIVILFFIIGSLPSQEPTLTEKLGRIFVVRLGIAGLLLLVFTTNAILLRDRRREIRNQTEEFTELVNQLKLENESIKLDVQYLSDLCRRRFRALGVYIHGFDDSGRLTLMGHSSPATSLVRKFDKKWDFVAKARNGEYYICSQIDKHPYFNHLKRHSNDLSLVHQVRSFASFPIKNIGKPIGLLTVIFASTDPVKEKGFVVKHQNLIDMLGRLISIDLHTQLRGTAFANLENVATQVSTNLDVNARLPVLISEATRLLRVPYATVYLVSERRDSLILSASTKLNERIPLGYSLHFGEGIAGLVAESKETKIENNYAQSKFGLSDFKEICVKAIGVPLIVEDELIGVVTAFTNDPDAPDFDAKHHTTGLLTSIASIVAQTVWFSRSLMLENKMQEAIKQIDNFVAEEIRADSNNNGRGDSVVAVSKAILEILKSVVHYDSASFQLLVNPAQYLNNIESTYLQIIAGNGFSDTENVLGLTFSLADPERPNRQVMENEFLYLPDIGKSNFQAMVNTVGLNDIRSWLGIKIPGAETPLGMIAFDRSKEIIPFNKQEIQLACRLAAHVAIAVKNVQDLEKQKAYNRMITDLYFHDHIVDYNKYREQIYQKIVQQAIQLTRLQGLEINVSCHLIQVKGNFVRLLAAYPKESHEKIVKADRHVVNLDAWPANGQGSILSQVIRTGKTAILADGKYDYFAISDEAEVIGSLLAVPILLKNRVIGIVVVSCPDAGHFGLHNVAEIEVLGSQAATILSLSQLVSLRLGLTAMTVPIMNDQHGIRENIRKVIEQLDWLESFRFQLISLNEIRQYLQKIEERLDAISLPLNQNDDVKTDLNSLVVTTLARSSVRHLPPEFQGNFVIRCDDQWIAEALRNVFVNADKALPDDNHYIAVVVRPCYRQDESNPTDMLPNGLFIEVTNQAGRMKNESLFLLFDAPIHDSSEGRMQLGAFIASQIIEYYGGYITIGTITDDTTTVVIWLPQELVEYQ
jgi:GAF domain-containing protein